MCYCYVGVDIKNEISKFVLVWITFLTHLKSITFIRVRSIVHQKVKWTWRPITPRNTRVCAIFSWT